MARVRISGRTGGGSEVVREPEEPGINVLRVLEGLPPELCNRNERLGLMEIVAGPRYSLRGTRGRKRPQAYLPEKFTSGGSTTDAGSTRSVNPAVRRAG